SHQEVLSLPAGEHIAVRLAPEAR
ncbi:MAG: hypothetical protein RLZZ299_51, partial [Pseudomonadota bacterium]